MKTKVVHSLSKTAWNVVGTIPGEKYKIARIPYTAVPENEIYTTREKVEALEIALYISKSLDNF